MQQEFSTKRRTLLVFKFKFARAVHVLKESRTYLRSDLKAMESEKKKLDAHSVDVITLNVGGEKFVTRYQTLKKYPNSLFMTMFSSTHEPNKNQDESYFIDRDGTLFRHLINFMRSGKTTTRMKELAEELIEEANFFRLPELVEALSQKDCKQDDEIVKLNVGGVIFQTSSSTLQKDPNSMLAAMFSGRFGAVRQKNGTYFIDRDGTHFRHILNFLRMGKIPNEIIAEAGEELVEEAEFYNLQSLVDTIATLKPIKINNDGEFLTTTMEIFCKHGFADLFFNMAQETPEIGGTFFVSPPVRNLAEVIMFLKEEEIPIDRLLDVKVNLFSSAIYLDFKYLQNYLTDFTGSKIIDDKKEYIDILKTWLRGKDICPLPCLMSQQLSLSERSSCNVTNGFSCPGDSRSNVFLAGEKEFQISKLEVFAI